MKLARAKLVKTSGTLSLLAVAVITSSLARADDSAWYGGASVGRSMSKIDDAGISSGLLSGGLSATSINDDDRDTGYKIFGGYQINKNFAIEGGYFDLGEFGFSATTVPAGTLNGNIRLKGLNLDLVGIVPITEKFAGFARVGMNYADAKDHFSGTGAVSVLNPNPSKREANYKAGLGVQYDLTPSLAMRAEAERYRINDAVGNKGDVDLVSVGMIYRFGVKAPALAPVAAASEPQPVAELAPPVPTKVSFAADSLFDFGKANVKPDGKQALDTFADDLKGIDFEVIRVTGHTDRIGSHASNMRLSMHRAEAVKRYLVETAGIPATKVAAKGVDGAEPVTKPEDCRGTKATKALIACLQPDRRVEVEVSGTK